MSLARQIPLRPWCRIAASSARSRALSTTPAVAAAGTFRKGRQQQLFAEPSNDDTAPAARSRGPRARQKKSGGGGGAGLLDRKPSRYRVSGGALKAPPKITPEGLPQVLLNRLDEWVGSERVKQRLTTLGFGEEEAEHTLQAWHAKTVGDLETWQEGNEPVVPAMAKLGWDAETLILAYEAGSHGAVFESAFLRHFVQFASEAGPEELRLHLAAILEATDLTHLAQTYGPARRINRQFHLHMGPTNSGKTYNALKALSRAKTGVYAGPLRLLAHEVWERLNLGTVGDLNGNGRKCNMITGEERRIVDPEAGLMSCTVEMVPLSGRPGSEPWDVVVIDEIQMMGDERRGGAWTAAVMGVNAREIHLCGDDTTVALLQTMVDGFKGDTLTIHRYDRLTPLTVAQHSLEGDWNNVAPGDCVVTFSRSNVFAAKKAIEESVGKRCAVVYGGLPPETRAEQAREFNEPTGRAEIMVASDAVGMGLNLKIGRIIFESLSKFDGKKEVPLSLSQIKQIAGRAGRFGQAREEGTTTDDVPATGGVVTTLHGADLPLLRAMLPLPLPPLTRAAIEIPQQAQFAFAPLLPPSTSYPQILDNFAALAKLPPNTVLTDVTKDIPLGDVVEDFRDVLSLVEMELFVDVPVSHRNPTAMAIYRNIVASFAKHYEVRVEDVLESSKLLKTLETVEQTLSALPPSPRTPGMHRASLSPAMTVSAIPQMETLHKALVMYIWLSFRLELAFPDRQLATEYKARTERVLDVCLERLPGVRPKRRTERAKRDDREHAPHRRKQADRPGLVQPSAAWVERQREARSSEREKLWRNYALAVDDRKH